MLVFLLQYLIEFLSIMTYSIMHDMILDSLEKCCRIGKIKPVCSIYNLFLFLSLSLDSFYCWLISYMVWFLCKTHYWFAKYVHLLCTRNQAIRIWKKARKSFLSHGTRKEEPPFHPFSFHSQNRWDRFFSSAHMHAINNFFDIGVVISPVFSARSQMEEKSRSTEASLTSRVYSPSVCVCYCQCRCRCYYYRFSIFNAHKIILMKLSCIIIRFW